MININLKIEKKDLWLLSAIMVFLIGVGYVVAYGGSQPPAVMGHSIGELENVQYKITNGMTACSAANLAIKTINPDTGAVTCEADDTGGGVTSLSAGTGITLNPNPITSTGTVSADTNYLQRRVTTDCGGYQVMRIIGSTGIATCVGRLPAQDIAVCGRNPTCYPRATLTGSCGGACTITSSSGSCTAPSSDRGGVRCQPI